MQEEPYDFDRPIDRRGTSSLKWEHFGSDSVIPMWLADMDFAAPAAVVDALRHRVEHGIFGYTLPPKSLVSAVIAHLQAQYGWRIEPEWLVWLPGVVPGLNLAVRVLTDPGQAVLMATPTYPPILEAPALAGRKRITVPFQKQGNLWKLACADLATAATPQTGLFVFCNPHNPVGHAFSRLELERIAEFCLSRNLTVCSDEIHCGLILDDVPHIPLASLSPEMARRTITLMSPSKTFNLAGLNCAYAVIPDPALRKRFLAAKAGLVPWPNALGYTACEAAYTGGNSWHRQLIHYLRGNRDLVERFMVEHLPGLSTTHVQATYLAWIDARHSGIASPAACFEAAGVGLSDGRQFGADGFVRLNFACPRSRLREVLERMRQAMRVRGELT